ncbi:ParA family protein [Jannaschia sp. LMIT008]|uniref:ParA family protein n=1 Tax=Jannaschia maritima TaxID=3032585 RepID=UPI0028116E54|nr:ParA family protein [Jannaschia sp. LMIT008]
MRAEIVSVANQKGGVGKTTTAINFGAALAARGLKVLIVDLDPQGNASTGLGIDRTARTQSVYDVLLDGAPVDDVARSTGFDGLDIIPATTDLSSADTQLIASPRRVTHLKSALTRSNRKDDVVLIDCPPALNLLTINALVACRSVLVPLQSEFFALEGLSQLLLSIKNIRQTANPELRLGGVVLTMFDARNNISRQVEADVRGTLGDLVFQTRIPRNVRLSEAQSYAMPILAFDPSSRGAIAYKTLAGEFLRRIQPTQEVQHAG